MFLTKIINFKAKRNQLTFHKTKEEQLKELKIIELSKKDPKHFGLIYERYHHEIFVFINKKTDDLNVSGDLTSQVFMKAMQNLSKFEYRGVPFSAWLYRIASNEANLYFRKQSKQRAINIETPGVEKMMELFDPGEERDIEPVIQAIAKLKVEEVELVELRFFEKFSYKEIAYIRNTTENNAKVKTFRVIKRIRKIMGLI